MCGPLKEGCPTEVEEMAGKWTRRLLKAAAYGVGVLVVLLCDAAEA
jgi:hypothetical protein